MIRARASKANTQKWYASTSALLNRSIPTLYHDYANQRYYNSEDGETSFPFTGTRTTNAMQFDAQGRLVWAPHQLCTRGNDFTNWASLGGSGNVALSGDTAPTGSPSYILTYTSPTPGSGLTIGGQSVTLGNSNQRVKHSFSIYVKKTNHQWLRMIIYSGTVTANQIRAFIDLDNKTFGSLGVHIPAGSGALDVGGSLVDVGGGWLRATIYGYNPFSSTTDAQLLITTCAVDNDITRVGSGASVEIASALWEMWGPDTPTVWRTEYETTGSAWYGPRFDYDPATGEALGLLSENARTNNMQQSFMLNLGTGVAFASSAAEDGPNYLGGWSSARYTGDGTLNQHFFYTSAVTPSASQNIYVSAIVAYVDGRYVQLTTSANWPVDANNNYMNIDMVDGVIAATGSAITSPFIRKLANGVYHVGFNCVSSASPTPGAGVIVTSIPFSVSSRMVSWTGTESFDIIYLQNSLGTTGYSSVIPTFGNTATMGADSFVGSTGSWLNASRGVVYADFTRAFVSPTNGASFYSLRLMTDSSNWLGLLNGSSTHSQHRFDVFDGGLPQAQRQTSVGSTSFSRRKMAGIYATNFFNGAENGVVGSADIGGTVPAITTIAVGSGNSSGTATQGWIREIRYYNTADATTAQLETLTT